MTSDREVNKNNLLDEQFLIFFAQKFRKIINWVGSFQFWDSKPKYVFLLGTLKMLPIKFNTIIG